METIEVAYDITRRVAEPSQYPSNHRPRSTRPPCAVHNNAVSDTERGHNPIDRLAHPLCFTAWICRDEPSVEIFQVHRMKHLNRGWVVWRLIVGQANDVAKPQPR